MKASLKRLLLSTPVFQVLQGVLAHALVQLHPQHFDPVALSTDSCVKPFTCRLLQSCGGFPTVPLRLDA